MHLTLHSSDAALLADAKATAVAFFESEAVLEYEKALDSSTGAAALTMRWAEAVNAITPVAGTPYEVLAVAPPNVRVEIDELTKTGEQYTATGFVELASRPGSIATTAPPTSGPPTTATFVVDLVFERDGADVVLVDYRLDDVPYPVSELYEEYADDTKVVAVVESDTSTTGDASTTSTGDSAADIKLRMGHRNLDGSVQYEITYAVEGLELTGAEFIDPVEGADDRAPPADATGSSADVYSNDPSGEETQALVVRPGAFPGGAGWLRLTFGEGADQKRFDVEVPEPPELQPRPVNQVRDAQTGSTTTSTTTTTAPTTTTVGPTTSTPPTTSGPTTSTSSTTTTTD